MHDRRRHAREEAFFPVQIDSTEKADRVGMVRNRSDSGLLIGTPSRFSVGEKLRLTFAPEPGQTRRAVVGRVVRTGIDDEADLFRQLIGVELQTENAA